jgi:Putative zinc-finger
MDHTAVVRQKMTERYLLGELDSQLRDEFEEHYFGCPECALDVSAGAQFVAHSKTVLAEAPEPVAVRATPRRNAGGGWFAWLRPAFAAPVLALLLAVIAYQNRVNSRLQQAANSPQLLTLAVVNVDTRGKEPVPVAAHAGHAFVLSLNVPSDGRYTSYKLDLFSPHGSLEWSGTIPASAEETPSIYIPGSDHEPGTLAVYGITADGKSEDLGRHFIELQNQK